MDKIIYKNQLEYIESLTKESDPVISEMVDFAFKNKIPILDRQSASFLEMIIKMIKCGRVLEIGTAIAYSSIRMARIIKRKGKVHTIEKSKDNILLAEKNIKKATLKNKIKIFEGDAFDVIPQLKKKYDLIFLDADKQDYIALLNLSVKLLKKGGVIFVDNLLWHGYAAAKTVPEKFIPSTKNIRDFNKLFISNPKLKSCIFPIGDGIGIGIKTKKKK